jgi:alpha-glucosidase (family GH31 glycosyl hydrolase)
MRTKVLLTIAFLYLYIGIASAQTGKNAEITLSDTLSLHQTTIDKEGSKFLIHTVEGWNMRISFINNSMVRVQMAPAAGFEPSLTERFGFVSTDWKETPVKLVELPGYTILQGENVGVKIAKQDLRISLLDKHGIEITGERAARSWLPAGGGRLRFSMPADEHIFGFGFQRKTMDCRGYKFDWKREFRKKDATIPFFLSTKGYAFLSNNTFDQTFDFANFANGYDVTAVDGQLDFYFIYGPQFANILDNYTQLTGAPQLIPKWGLGLLYGCRYYESQQGVLDLALNFRKFDIPCDMMWLEPGWEDHSYSMKWEWSPERFPDPAGMIKQLNSKGYHFGLWDSGQAPHKGYEDSILRVNWYAQRVKTSLDLGVAFFKQDDPYPRMIESTEMSLNPIYNKGTIADKIRSNRALKNLSNSLYSETAMNEFRRITGKRTFIIFNSYVSSFGTHRWPTGWAADFAAGNGMLNAGLAAQSMVSLDMNPGSVAGMHLGYLTPFSIIDAWAYYKEPWLYPTYLLDAHRFYSKFRRRLMPYLYSSQAQSHFTGMPMMRAMVLQYQNDSATWKQDRQYMLGDALLVGLDAKVYLPKGEWVDYWNGERIESKGEWYTRTLKDTQGGPLFAKAGSIIPMQSVTAFQEQEKTVLVTLDVFPAKQGKGWLYEDDGNSFDYEKGKFAKTEFTFQKTDNGLIVKAEARTGDFKDMPKRVYLMQIHNLKDVKIIICNGKSITAVKSKELLLNNSDKSGWWYDANNHTLYIKPGSNWKLGYDSRGSNGDPDKDSFIVSGKIKSEDNGFDCKIETGFTNEANILPTTTILVPDRLELVANPPQRILLQDNASWLPRKATIYVSVMSGNKVVESANNKILFEVLDETGKIIRSFEKNAVKGKATFNGESALNTEFKRDEQVIIGEEYMEEKTVFRVSSPGFDPVEIKIKKAETLKGNK